MCPTSAFRGKDVTDFGDSDISQILFNCGCTEIRHLIHISSIHYQYTRLICMKLRLTVDHESSHFLFFFFFLILVAVQKRIDKWFENEVFSLLK